MNTLAFDIETVPDVDLGRRLYELDGLDDAAVAHVMTVKQRQVRNSDVLPPHQQRVIAISCVMRSSEGVRVFSLGEEQAGEKELVQRFFDGLDRYAPTLVSWNGSGFDLPVLHYRGLLHGISAGCYWDQGEDDREFKWNNYISRYHARHLDLMDLLAMYQPRGGVPLDQLAQLLGFPGKIGVGGGQVWQAWQDGKIADIRNYCEADVANTYLVFLRFQLMRCALTKDRYEHEIALVRATLEKSPEPHWREFVELWRS